MYFEYKSPRLKQGQRETEKSIAVRQGLADEAAARQNRTYNDGATFIERQWMVDSTTGIHQWLNDLMDVLGVDAKRLPIPKPRQTKQEKTAVAMLAGEEIQL